MYRASIASYIVGRFQVKIVDKCKSVLMLMRKFAGSKGEPFSTHWTSFCVHLQQKINL